MTWWVLLQSCPCALRPIHDHLTTTFTTTFTILPLHLPRRLCSPMILWQSAALWLLMWQVVDCHILMTASAILLRPNHINDFWCLAGVVPSGTGWQCLPMTRWLRERFISYFGSMSDLTNARSSLTFCPTSWICVDCADMFRRGAVNILLLACMPVPGSGPDESSIGKLGGPQTRLSLLKFIIIKWALPRFGKVLSWINFQSVGFIVHFKL